MIYILHQEDKVPIRIQSKKSCLRRIFFDKFCLQRSLFTKKLACRAFFLNKNLVHGPFHFSAFFGLPIDWYLIMIAFITFNSSLVPLIEGLCSSNPWKSDWKWFEFKNSVITTTLLVKNINEESVKQQILRQIKPREIRIAQHQFSSKTVYKRTEYVITSNSNIKTTRLVFIRLRFHAVSSHLLLSPLHSNDLLLRHTAWWANSVATHRTSVCLPLPCRASSLCLFARQAQWQCLSLNRHNQGACCRLQAKFRSLTAACSSSSRILSFVSNR